MPARAVIPPCASEMNSQLGLALAENLQSRRTTGRYVPLVAVMAGLPPQEHFEQGLLSKSPLDEAPEVPADLCFAVDKIIKTENIDPTLYKLTNISELDFAIPANYSA